ncbi:MAG: hypothetical protein GYA61_08300 [Spirochaetales bacterium]|nr:hypothetical protein [Spirochaetales bacterium]
MKNLEKIISGLIIGSIFPLSLGLITLSLWFMFDKSESRPLIYLIFGVLIGGLIDLKFIKTWINNRFNLPTWIIALIYIVYNIFVFGFFMGFPVFNVLLGLLAGYYYANRICSNKIDPTRYKKLLNQVSLFTGIIMTLVCISSGFLAIYNNGAAGMIQDLLGLPFEVTRSMLWMIVVIGGLVLVLITVLLTRFTMFKIIRNYRN